MRDPLWRRYLRFWGPDVCSDVDDELAFHVELRVDELIAHGMDPAAAREEAWRRLGDVDALARKCRAITGERLTIERRREWLTGAWTELRVAVRQLLRFPVLAGVAVLTLALGLGATTAIFSVLYAVLLRPLPYADADRIVRITETQRGDETPVGPGQFTEWSRRARAFDAIGAYLPTTYNLTDGSPERVRAAFATSGFFRARYLTPALGRYLLPEEEQPGREHVVVLSDALFRQRYGSDPRVVGRTIRLNDQAYTVIGVAPPDFSLASAGDMLWTPLALTAQHKITFSEHWLTVYAKRRAGVSLADAQHDIERVSRGLADEHPRDMIDFSARVLDFRSDLIADHERNLVVLFGGVGCVLLLACLNVANLLLVRATVRRKEIAIRAALGATRADIVRHFVTESLVLGGVGAALAFVVSRLTLGVLLQLAPDEIPGLAHAGEGPSGVLFLAATALAVAMGLGLLPALRGLRWLQPALRMGGRTSNADSDRDRLRSVLAVSEVALALVLLTAAGLFVQSARRLNDIDPGFDPSRLVTARISLSPSRYPTDEHLQRTYADLIARVRQLPHVTAASANSSPPLAGGAVGVEVKVEGRTYAPGTEPEAQFHTVTADYFETVRMPLREGRALGRSDAARTPAVVVINETLARRLWPNEPAISKRIACCAPDSTRIWREVVGVVGDARQFLTRDPLPELYVPIEQAPPASWIWHANSLALMVRTDGDVASVFRGIRAAVAAIDPTLPVYDAWTYDDIVQHGAAANRFSTVLFSGLAALALVLAAVGIYGVLAFSVAQRTFEMGVRLALGARPLDVLALVTRQGMMLVGGGLAIGFVLAIATSRTIASLLYQVAPTDRLTYTVAVALLAAVGALACYVPARRAAAVDPATTFRA
jgi:putative ABC transport system permease protein